MRMLRAFLVLSVLSAGALQAQVSRGSYMAADLEGAWLRVESISATGLIEPSPPAIRTFVDGYYSWIQAPADRPSVDSTATAAQLRAVWGTVTANSGRYEVVGHTMTQRTTVDRTPGNMKNDFFATFAIRLAADSMWITQIVTSNGPLANQASGKYVRVR
jgi:hypothetical protein